MANYNSFGRSVRRTKNAFVDFMSTKGKQNLIVVGALVVLVAVFGILNSNFLSTDTIVSMTQSLAPYAVMALGVTFVIATGGIDLSIGTVCIASAVIAGKLYMEGMPLWATIPVMISIGTLFGFINGLLVAKLKLPAFIATLGTMMLSRGLSAIIAAIPNIFFFSRPEDDGVWFKQLFSNANGVPTGLFWVIGLALICMYLMYKSKIGRYILSIGSNEEATRLSGINTDKYKVIAYTIGGMAAGIAAIFWAASFPTVAAATGNGMELDTIAGVYIGGTSAAGGVASIAGSVIGNIMLVVIRSGLNFVLAKFDLNLNSTYVTFVLTGIIVVVAVLMDVLKNKNAAKVKIETPKAAAKRARKQALADKETEIDNVIASKDLTQDEKNAKISAIEAEIKAL
ncbi:MAG: ABC transporter permease [Ruminococcaceae bacterium]|nr:ABC transporter permease [Oscillospiraceae bacterium]